MLYALFLAFFVSFSVFGETQEAKDLKKLARGEVVIHMELSPGSHFKKGVTSAVFENDFEQVWGVITDFGHYKEFMPRVTKSEILEKSETEVKYFSYLKMPFIISDVSYQCVVKMDKPKRNISFEIVEGTQKGVKSFSGTWDFEAFQGNEKKTLAKYNLVFVPEKGYPPWMVNMGTKSTIGKIMETVRKRLLQVDLKTEM